MIDLTALRLAGHAPRIIDFGGVLTPALGGPVQRIQRLGSRWSLALTSPAMPNEPDGRIWASRLARAKIEGGLVSVPEPGLDFLAIGAPTVAAAVAGGTQVPLQGMTAGRTIPEGKWVSLIHDARRYLYQVTADVVVAPNGTATISVFPMLRTELTAGDVAEIAAPKAQGDIEGDFGWAVDVDEAPAFSFTIAEDE